MGTLTTEEVSRLLCAWATHTERLWGLPIRLPDGAQLFRVVIGGNHVVEYACNKTVVGGLPVKAVGTLRSDGCESQFVAQWIDGELDSAQVTLPVNYRLPSDMMYVQVKYERGKPMSFRAAGIDAMVRLAALLAHACGEWEVQAATRDELVRMYFTGQLPQVVVARARAILR